jgi:glycosyltransferase involved in cell wall biosynthesis
MNTPLFSIIIPTFNHAHLIKKCLLSLIDQTYPNWEAIVVNNYSEDDTIEVVESFQDSRIRIINFHNQGIIAAARNEGIRSSKGNWIAFLDSDDWWYPSKLTKILPLLDNYDLIYHKLDIYKPTGKGWGEIRGHCYMSPIFDNLLVKGNQIPNSSALIKKQVIEEVGYLSEEPNLFAIEDYDLWLRVSKLTERFYYLNQSLGAYWVGGENYSKADRKSIGRMKFLYSKHLPTISEKSKKSAQAILCYIVTRERMLCGDPNLFWDFFKILPYLKRRKFFFNSILFGILSLFYLKPKPEK